MFDDDSEMEPPKSISNSEVNSLCADGSVGSLHVRVGRCQAPLIDFPRETTSVRSISFCTRALLKMSLPTVLYNEENPIRAPLLYRVEHKQNELDLLLFNKT